MKQSVLFSTGFNEPEPAKVEPVTSEPDPVRRKGECAEILQALQWAGENGLTNGFSKSLDHHAAMQGLFFCWYNWCRKHETLKATPAQASGLADKQWSIIELLEKIS